jgi:hypothetical protein
LPLQRDEDSFYSIIVVNMSGYKIRVIACKTLIIWNSLKSTLYATKDAPDGKNNEKDAGD